MSWSVETTPGLGRERSLNGITDRGIRLNPDLEGSFLAHGAARANLDLLLSGDALCVTTGQQPGLLTGPVMTVYKAISAAALAERLTVALGRPVVPVFWVAGDDHDFDEVNHLQLVSSHNEATTITLRSRDAAAPAAAMYEEPVGVEVARVFEEIEQLSPPTEFREEVLATFKRHYRPEATMAGSFAGVVAELLSDLGIVVFEPYTTQAKRHTVPVMTAAIERSRNICEALIARCDALQAAGHAVPVSVQDDHTLVMMIGAQGRDRLLMDGDEFHLRRSGERFRRDELLRLIENEPERFSPNVLLRPVAEATLLPTVAYVAGPTEAAYWAQAEPVFDLLAVPRQSVVPRWSGRVVEPRVTKVLEKYHVTIDELGLDAGQLESRLARADLPADIVETMGGLRTEIAERFQNLVRAAMEIEPTLEKPVMGAQHQMYSQLDHIEKKIVTQLKKRNEVLVRQLATARTAMFPMHKPQERVVNVLQYLIRHGPDYLTAVAETCRAWVAEFELPASVT